MTLPDGTVFYSPYHKFMVCFVFDKVEKQALSIFRAPTSPIEALWGFPKECVFQTPLSDMKIILATFEATMAAEAALTTIQEQFYQHGLTLDIGPFANKEQEDTYLSILGQAEEMTI